MFSNARDLQIVDSTNTVAGRDVVYSNIHYHYERPRDIWAILQSIPNFRQIYHDMLSKATPGTGMWLVKGDKFRLWLEPNGDIKIFWGSGIPGAGKTLLASIVIEHLEALCKETDARICVCYVFFRYSDRSEVAVRSILEILVMQTHERHPDCQALIEQAYSQHLRERTEPTEAQLLALLRQLTDGMAITFYILDALDEAPTKIQLAVVKTLASLNVKLFITSRPLKTVEANFLTAHTFDITAQDTDIDLHIAKGISENAELQRVLNANPSLRDEIISTIKGDCGGMFLHASLQLDALGECFSAQDVRATLKAFPLSIEDVYRQTWTRISNEGRKHASLAQAVLIWVLNASRSMTIEELERAVATSPDTHKFEPGRLVSGSTLLSLCGGLITVEDESRLVRLVHYTAKDTLKHLLHEAFPHPHSLLAAVCMTHLTECGFQNTTINSEEEFKTVLEKDPLLAYASEAWAFHVHEELGSEDIRHRTAQFVTEATAFPAFTSSDLSWYFDILSPIHILGLYHLPLILIGDTAAGNPNQTTKLHQQSALIVAAREGYKSIVKLLLAHSNIQVNRVDNEEWSALMMAAGYGYEGTVELLVTHPDIQVNLVDDGQWSALMMAARYGHEGTVKLLLAHPDIQVNLVGGDGRSALMLAARYGYEGTVKHVLAHPDIQVNLLNNQGWSALMLAARYGHEATIKFLLEHPDIQVNLVSNKGWSALMMAASEGYESAIKLLLGHPDIQVNLVNNDSSTALLLAAQHGHNTTVELILATNDVHLNAFDKDGETAIKMAAQYGHEAIVCLLLDITNIDTTIRSTADGHTALSAAQANSHSSIVELLRKFESRNAAVASPLGTHPLSGQENRNEHESDSDSSEGYFDAEESFGEDVDQGEAVI
ncbi:ankyrin repeat-containing domain protein [Coprinopsis sp. MPI-PUGE-AT-0042]|nr:ankyrin repeat-containing domain protein [Coprinopsis sp. MPI-PUGE-AT-0042]